MLKHPGIAVVFSFIFTGLGQLYNGQIKKGLLIIFVSALNMLLLVIGSILLGFWLLGKLPGRGVLVSGILFFGIGLIAVCIVGIYSIVDAYKVATQQ
jgi:hypothetical protein